MDNHSHRPDDLSALERRLIGCEPAVGRLSADAMLFAAGRASARPGLMRLVWPALAGCLAVLAVVLGVWLATERSTRLDLARQLRQRTPVPAPELAPAVAPTEPSSTGERSPNSLFSARRALEQGLEAWPPQAVDGPETPGPLPPDPPILHGGWRDVQLAP